MTIQSINGYRSDKAANGHANGHANGLKRKLEDYSSESYPTLEYEARYKKLPQTQNKINHFIGGYFKEYNLSAVLEAARLDDEEHVKLEVWSPPAGEKPSFQEALKQTYKPVKKGTKFGPNWSNHWFKVSIRIPDEYKSYERVQFEFDGEGEAMVFDTKGNVFHGLTGGPGVDRRVEFIIPEADHQRGFGEYYIEASCNGMFGVHDKLFDGEYTPRRQWTLLSADLVVPNMVALNLRRDFEYIQQLSQQLPKDSSMAQTAKVTANAMINAFRVGDLETCKAARIAAEPILGKDWESLIEKEVENPSKDGTLWALGHCHIDTAWLWPYSVTQQKAGRSWSIQCDLIDRYPEYVFTATQPQQYKWVEQFYPELFKRIQTKVDGGRGRFQPLGCTWVEMDTNLPSGEALARQFLYGQRYFEKKFGFRSKTFVLPDTFGYSSQLPQISRLSGAPNFFTQKLSWNDTNTFPHSTFNWAGIDGSQVLSHMTPVDAYNSQCTVTELAKGVKNKNTEVTKHALLLFGNGDGGGGPTEPMLEQLRRHRATLSNRNDAGGHLPQVRYGGSFEEFYDTVRAETNNGRDLPVWHGELYLEIHRATYTTAGAIKRGNRKSENYLREAEYAATMASIQDPSYKYPKEKLDAIWEDVLLNQFHDVLPGSSVNEANVDAVAIYKDVEERVNQLIVEAYNVLYSGTSELTAKATKGSIIGINTIPGTLRQEVVQVPIGSVNGQASSDGKSEYAVLDVDKKTDLAVVVSPQPAGASAKTLGHEEYELSNESLKVIVKGGRITSIVDKALNKELIDQGQSAGLVIFEDHPNFWDAWDVDVYHLEKATHLKFDTVEVSEAGPLRAALQASLKYGDSTLTFTISLDAISAPGSASANARSLLRIDAHADWHQKHEFLKFELPVNIHNETATYDTQFGVVTRATHTNTSWDAARYEVCAHKFADLSEWGYGVSLINESKYGYATRGNVMTLSLLRGPVMPDPEMDMGEHNFSFAIYPHVGTFAESDVPAVATAFNRPLHVRAGASAATASTFSGSPFALEGAPNVTLEAIKRGEDDREGHKTVIIRLFEQYGGSANASLKISKLNVKQAEVVNILEDHVEDLEIVNTGADVAIQLPFRGFEIKTVRLTL